MQWKKLKMTYSGLEFYQMKVHLYVARMDLISSRNVWVCIGRQFNMNAELSHCDMVWYTALKFVMSSPHDIYKTIVYLY